MEIILSNSANLTLNPNLIPFRNKEGQYVEVIAILPSKLIVLYACDQTESLEISSDQVKIGDLILFHSDLTYHKTIRPTLLVSSSLQNKQSPSVLMKDPNART